MQAKRFLLRAAIVALLVAAVWAFGRFGPAQEDGPHPAVEVPIDEWTPFPR